MRAPVEPPVAAVRGPEFLKHNPEFLYNETRFAPAGSAVGRRVRGQSDEDNPSREHGADSTGCLKVFGEMPIE